MAIVLAMTDCSEEIFCPTYRNAMVKDIQTEFSISHVLTSCCRACLWYRVSESSEKTITKYSWFIFRMHDLTQTPHWSQWWNYTMKGRICSLDQKTHAYFLRSWRLRSTNRSLVLYVILCEFETEIKTSNGCQNSIGLGERTKYNAGIKNTLSTTYTYLFTAIPCPISNRIQLKQRFQLTANTYIWTCVLNQGDIPRIFVRFIWQIRAVMCAVNVTAMASGHVCDRQTTK